MAFTLRQLQFFIAAAEAGSVSGAARALSISQSSITEAIRALEDDLGITLFDRLARGIDRCDADLVRAVFHPDATDDHGMYKGTAADFVPWVMEVLAGMRRTQHMIGNVLIEVDGDKVGLAEGPIVGTGDAPSIAAASRRRGSMARSTSSST